MYKYYICMARIQKKTYRGTNKQIYRGRMRGRGREREREREEREREREREDR